MRAEILIDPPIAIRGERMLRALARCAPPGTRQTSRYVGAADVLVIYGPGAPRRMQITKMHLAGGPHRHVVMWDLGYWDREHSLRMSLDGMHPTAQHLASSPVVHRAMFQLREDADEHGPILLIGLGRKSCVAYGYHPMQWELDKLKQLQQRFPGREILWRPKGEEANLVRGTRLMHGMPIEAALKGCSLVVCRHSNVAVDACIAGVPVECEDGAGLALYHANPRPTQEQRSEFLQRLSWWNWGIGEAAQCWQWIAKLTRFSAST